MSSLPNGADQSLARIVGHGVADWAVEPLSGGIGNQAGEVLRVCGRRSGDAWSVVLKILRPAAAGSVFPAIGTVPQGWGRSARHSHYWRREARFYDSELPARLETPEARTPRPLFVEDHGHEVWIWLEDIADDIPGPWPADRLIRAAQQVAGLTAASAPAALVPDPALLPHALRAWVDDLQAANITAAADRRTWSHPHIKITLPDGNLARMRRLFEDRDVLLDALAAAPQAVVHLDAHRRNVLTANGPQGESSVLIDWAYAGTGAVGEDLGSLVGMTFMLGEIAPCDTRDVSNAAFDAYIEGLRSAGWDGDERRVRFAGHATCALQAGMLSSNLAGLADIDPGADPALDELIRDSSELLSGTNDHFLWHTDEAWRLLEVAERD